MVERSFAGITCWRIRHGSDASVNDPKAAIDDDLAQHNETPKPFEWTRSAESILTRQRRAPDALDEVRGNS